MKKRNNKIENLEINHTPEQSKYYSFNLIIDGKKYEGCAPYKKFLDFCGVKIYLFLEILYKGTHHEIHTLDNKFR